MRTIRRSIAALLLTVQLAACTTFRPTELSPEAAVETNTDIRVRLTDGSKVRVRTPWVRGDSLGGTRVTGGGAYGKIELTEWAVPMDSVALIETRHSDALATTGLILGIAGGIVLMGVLVCAASSCGPTAGGY